MAAHQYPTLPILRVLHYDLFGYTGIQWDTGRILDETLLHSWGMMQTLVNEQSTEERADIEYIMSIHAKTCITKAGLEDCNEVCSRAETLFSSQIILRGCLTLAWISLAPLIFPQVRDILALSTAEPLEELGVANATDFDGRVVLNATCQCAKASCLTDTMGDCMQSFEKCSNFTSGKREEWDVLGSDLCSGVKQELNNDIAGSGVSGSHSINTSYLGSRRESQLHINI